MKLTTRQKRADLPTAVYRCYDADGGLLYIGMSVNPKQRLYQHRSRRSPWVDRYASMTEEWFAGPRAAMKARDAEVAAIAAERPAFNLEHNPGGPTVRRRRGAYPNPPGQNQHVQRTRRRCVLCGRPGVQAFLPVDRNNPATGWKCSCTWACEQRQVLRPVG